MTLSDKVIAILIAPCGTEDPAFAKPRAAIEWADDTVVVVGLSAEDA